METIGKIHSLESFGTVDGPGIRFVVFMQGCPLRCQYCHNPDTWNIKQSKHRYTPAQLLEEVLKYKNFIRKGGVTATGGEPLLQAPFLTEFYQLCRQENLHTAIDTSGYIHTPESKQTLEIVDLVLLDLKTIDPHQHTVLTGVPIEPVLKTLEYLESIGKPTWIRHVIVPGLTDSNSLLNRLADHLKNYRVIEKVELLPYHTMGQYKYEQLGLAYALKGIDPLSKERLENAQEIFKNKGFTVQ